MANDGNDVLVDQLLRHGGAGLRIGRIVFAHQLQLDLLAVDGQAFLVGFFNGQACAVFIVFAKVSNTARERSRVTDLDDGLAAASSRGRSRRCCGCSSLVCGLFLVLTASCYECHGSRKRQNFGKLNLHE